MTLIFILFHLHLDKGLLQKQNTKKLQWTKNNCMYTQLGQMVNQTQREQEPNCHFRGVSGKTRLHTHHHAGGKTTQATPQAQPLDPFLPWLY